jgi:hypothetical protein
MNPPTRTRVRRDRRRTRPRRLLSTNRTSVGCAGAVLKHRAASVTASGSSTRSRLDRPRRTPTPGIADAEPSDPPAWTDESTATSDATETTDTTDTTDTASTDATDPTPPETSGTDSTQPADEPLTVDELLALGRPDRARSCRRRGRPPALDAVRVCRRASPSASTCSTRRPTHGRRRARRPPRRGRRPHHDGTGSWRR